MEREALGILYGLGTFHHYCFACEIYVITDHKPLVVMVGKEWQHFHNTCSAQFYMGSPCILYGICILHKPDSELFIGYHATIRKRTKIGRYDA